MMTIRPLVPLLFASTCLCVTMAHAHIAGLPDPRRSAGESATGELPAVEINDNRRPAGTLKDGVLTLELRAARGTWHPEGSAGPGIEIEAFGDGASPLSVPAPLIRVPEGTAIAVSVRNDLPHALRVSGFCEHGSSACAAVEIGAGETRALRFKSGVAGTYSYWATSTGMPQPFRAVDDTQLSGAFVVDPPGATADDDRVFVITEWTSLTRTQLRTLAAEADPSAAFLSLRPEVLSLINGRSWPHTERLRYEVGQLARWRIVNLSTQAHPMHLHGFYFSVDALGDGTSDRAFADGQQPRAVTQLMRPGATMTMTWTPERAGNWLFHCHVMTHVSPVLHVDGSMKTQQAHADDHHDGAGMRGMVLGITVSDPHAAHGVPSPAATSTTAEVVNPRRLTLYMRNEVNRFGTEPAAGFSLDPPGATPGPLPVPGPTLVLARGEPVEITLVNGMSDATAIHWHGMELESYYDGAHGWGGNGEQVTPMVAPGSSFVVRFTPPRTGTFMYHTHLHERRQLTSGLYGAMLVVDPPAALDEATDHVLVLGRGGPQREAPVVVNGAVSAQFVWKAGTRHRLRLINITPDDIVAVSLQSGDAPVVWRPVTKDGAALPPDSDAPVPSRQIVGVGETYDFEFDAPPGRRTVWLEVRSPAGRWLSQGRIIIK